MDSWYLILDINKFQKQLILIPMRNTIILYTSKLPPWGIEGAGCLIRLLCSTWNIMMENRDLSIEVPLHALKQYLFWTCLYTHIDVKFHEKLPDEVH